VALRIVEFTRRGGGGGRRGGGGGACFAFAALGALPDLNWVLASKTGAFRTATPSRLLFDVLATTRYYGAVYSIKGIPTQYV